MTNKNIAPREDDDWYLKPILAPFIESLKKPNLTEDEIYNLLREVWWNGKFD